MKSNQVASDKNKKTNQRLNRELYEFFASHDISSEINITLKLIAELSGVQSLSEKGSAGFNFSQWNTEEEIEFRIPKLKIAELRKLFEFLNYSKPLDEYEVGSSIILDPDFVFDKLLPAIQQKFRELPKEEVSRYVVESKPQLEANARATLRNYTSAVLKTLCDIDAPTPSQNINDVIEALESLQAKLNNLDEYPVRYKSIIASAEKIKTCLENQEVKNNKTLEKQLKMVLEGIVLFEKYNRTESVIANHAFTKEMEKFLHTLKITSTGCDVIEQTLLKLAGASLGPNGRSSTQEGSDASRRTFHFYDMTKENAEKVIKYLQQAGDDTAMEGSGYRHYSTGAPASAAAPAASARGRSLPQKIAESHNIETDASVFYKIVFGRLKEHLSAASENDLEVYRKSSAEFFEEKKKEEEAAKAKEEKANEVKEEKTAEEKAPGKQGLFQPAVEQPVSPETPSTTPVVSLTTSS